jgi:hypothetical protein
MSYNTKGKVLRSIDQGINDMSRSQDNFVKGGAIYETTHPDIYKRFCGMVQALETLKQVAVTLKESI